MVRTLLNRPGIQINAGSNVGVTPLHLACKHSHAGVVTILAAAGEQAPSVVLQQGSNERGYTPCSLAGRKEQVYLTRTQFAVLSVLFVELELIRTGVQT